jgi:hypothetical protein
MPTRNGRTAEQVKHDIELEREELARALDSLRTGLGEATDITGKVREKLPVAVGGALAAGFVLAGGIGATMRLLARRGREGKRKAKFGPFSIVDDR